MTTALHEHTDSVLINVHSLSECARRSRRDSSCRSDHAMRSFPQSFRSDAGFIERICPHGIGHPDPDDPFAPSVHGCDGCCATSSTEDVEAFIAAFEEDTPDI